MLRRALVPDDPHITTGEPSELWFDRLPSTVISSTTQSFTIVEPLPTWIMSTFDELASTIFVPLPSPRSVTLFFRMLMFPEMVYVPFLRSTTPPPDGRLLI